MEWLLPRRVLDLSLIASMPPDTWESHYAKHGGSEADSALRPPEMDRYMAVNLNQLVRIFIFLTMSLSC